jgi:hypothetical protein
MAAATVTSTIPTLPQRAQSPLLTLAAIPITVTYSSTAYATSTGGLPFDLFTILAASSPFAGSINYKDIVGLIPLGPTVEKFIVGAFAIGTATSSTLPCTVRIYGTGSAEKAALTEVDDANLSGSFKALLLVARGGSN